MGDQEGDGRYRALFEQLDLPLTLNELVLEGTVPVDVRLVASNRAHDRLMNQPPGAMVGRTAFELHPEGAPTLLAAVVAALETGRPRALRSRYVSGQAYDVTIFPLDRLTVGITGQEVTDYLRAEAERERLLAEREELVRTISHDLRAPLASISSQAQLLAREPESDRVALKARGIAANARRMAGMIGDLVDLVRADQGIAIAPAPLAFGPFVTRLLERIDGGLESARVRVAVPDDLPPLHADPAKLERVLVNLLANALRYGPPGTPVEVTAARCDHAVAFEVSDRGPGIPPADLPRIFDRYFRAARTAGDGLGLGLHIARRFVEAHGGSIEARNDEGRGATFRVVWPSAG